MERDDLGKEKRFPVLLTAAEKLIARKVVLAFKVRGEGWGGGGEERDGEGGGEEGDSDGESAVRCFCFKSERVMMDGWYL